MRPLSRTRLAIGLVVIAAVWVAGSVVFSDHDDSIDARPASPAPPGFTLVGFDGHQLAIPLTWSFQELDHGALDALAATPTAAIPNAAGGMANAVRVAALNQSPGGRALAWDQVSGENMTLAAFTVVDGDPGSTGFLVDVTAYLRSHLGGYDPLGMDAAASDVHGFPATTVTINATYAGSPTTVVATFIGTGDSTYLLTVTSPSAERATTLSRQIVPTFGPT